MSVVGLHGDARVRFKSLLRARRCLESPLVFAIPSRPLFALALSSVIPASPSSSAPALCPQAEAELQKTSFFISSSVPMVPAARLPGGSGSPAELLLRRDGPDDPRRNAELPEVAAHLFSAGFEAVHAGSDCFVPFAERP